MKNSKLANESGQFATESAQDAEIADQFRLMLDAPPDLPASDLACLALVTALKSLSNRMPPAKSIAQRLSVAGQLASLRPAPGTLLFPLTRRIGRHLLYSTAIKIGAKVRRGDTCDERGLAIFGAWCLCRLMEPYQPTGQAIALADALLIEPNGDRARSWSATARSRALERALQRLESAVADHPAAALKFGLVTSSIRVVKSHDSIDLFNLAFRRRHENLIDFATKNSVAGAGGYGTLSAGGLIEAGRSLINGVRAGDHTAALVCLEIVTHLPSAVALAIPVKVDGLPHDRAYAWLNIASGEYCYLLYRLIDRGARPDTGSSHLYCESTQIVRIKLTRPLRDLLINALDRNGGTAKNVKDLLGDISHHPRASVLDGAGYRCTARRLQESIPALLLQSGHHRWPVALATNSHFLVSRGRSAYGVCGERLVWAATDASYDLLGWPSYVETQEGQLIGSFTSPKPQSIIGAADFLLRQANDSDQPASDMVSLVTKLNNHACWMAFLLALGLALRNWRAYSIDVTELRSGDCVHVLDKDVHELGDPPVPIAGFIGLAFKAWLKFCAEILQSLKALGDVQSLSLANHIEDWTNSLPNKTAVFTFDAVNRLEHAGSRTWHSKLPAYLRLRPNFARHYWPMQLMNRGIEQQLIDVLMRHQVDGLHSNSAGSVRLRHADRERLRASMDSVMLELNLRMPDALQRLCP